ncbi:VOC family protein [Natronincola peptidivorans]|uniref:VOC family protein n=1 Tax=Natronincola peptidivorans TaxID=426128 RepID=UPI0011144E93|nr:VOC family protein [Natronincola peptidivorans]
MKVKKFRHIGLVVKDYSKMMKFYSEVLGFEIIREFEIENEDFRKGVGISNAKAKGAHLIVPGNNVEIEISEYEQKIERCSELSLSNYPGYRHIAFIVENLEEAYNDLRKLGIEFISEPICVKEPKNVAGFQFVYFRDPEGNIIEINQLPE